MVDFLSLTAAGKKGKIFVRGKSDRPTEIIFEFYDLPWLFQPVGPKSEGVKECRLFKVSEIRFNERPKRHVVVVVVVADIKVIKTCEATIEQVLVRVQRFSRRTTRKLDTLEKRSKGFDVSSEEIKLILRTLQPF